MPHASTSSSKSDRRRAKARRHSLGQHYLSDSSVVESMLHAAGIEQGERVLEIGTGRGALTRELVGLTKELEGFEVDSENFEALKKELGNSVNLHNSDAFNSSAEFDVLISSLPYSESSTFVEWLAQRRYDRAVVLLQTDFAEKITAHPGIDAYRAVSVISQASAEAEIVARVPRSSFDPPPRVNSCIVKMRWKRTLGSEQISMIKKIFSQKRRTVRAALKSLGLEAPPSAPPLSQNELLQCRVGSLRPDSVLAMTGVLARARS